VIAPVARFRRTHFAEGGSGEAMKNHIHPFDFGKTIALFTGDTITSNQHVLGAVTEHSQQPRTLVIQVIQGFAVRCRKGPKSDL